MKWRILLGTLAIASVVGLLAFVALGERERMAGFTQSYHARQIEVGAALFENNCRTCHAPQGTGIEGVAPAINAADLFNGQRLTAIGYSGTVEDYVRGVIAAGRPIPSSGTNYPNRMPTWSQRYGGPLREDQVDSLVAYIMNWDEQAPGGAQPTAAVPSGDLAGTDISAALPQGEAESGQALAETLGCAGCHLLSTVGPAWRAEGSQRGIGDRAAERILQADYTGQAASAEQYLFESIVNADAFVIPGFEPGIMPANYGQRLGKQDLADLIAYLLSLR